MRCNDLSGDFSPGDAVDNWNIVSLVGQVEATRLTLSHTLETAVWTERELAYTLNLNANIKQCVDNAGHWMRPGCQPGYRICAV